MRSGSSTSSSLTSNGIGLNTKRDLRDEEEDAETLSGSQEQAEDLFFSDDGSLSDDTDLMAVGAQDKEPGVIQIRPGGTIHIAVAEDFDFDDLWASSQETLDVRASFRDAL